MVPQRFNPIFFRYKIGDAFMALPLEKAQERIEKETDVLTQELEKLQNEMDDLNGKMDELKGLLYSKFGKAINLEKD